MYLEINVIEKNICSTNKNLIEKNSFGVIVKKVKVGILSFKKLILVIKLNRQLFQET